MFDTSPMPVIRYVAAVGRHSLLVEWAEGRRANLSEVVDLGGHIHDYLYYRPIRSVEAFSAARVSEDGGEVRWGSAVTMSAVTIERLAMERNG